MLPPDAPKAHAPTAHALLDQDEPFLRGSGEMARRMRAHDWEHSPAGPVAAWPQSLRTAIGLCLASRFPIEIWWGPEYLRFYNDAYRPILGAIKHPQFLGRPGIECWGEIWDVISPMLDGVRASGEATWSEDFPLMLERNGYLEETFFTFSYAPISIEDGSVGGVFCACTETTVRVVGERRLRALRALAAEVSASDAPVDEAIERALATLGSGAADVAYALVYIVEEDGREARRVAASGIAVDAPRSPRVIALADDAPWPLGEAARSKVSVAVATPAGSGALPGGAWEEPSREARVHPLFAPGAVNELLGFLVIGVSPRRAFDAAYADFFTIAAEHLATLLARARDRDAERARAAEFFGGARRAQLGADVGAALTSAAPLLDQLRRCADAIVSNLGAAFARIWTLDVGSQVLELRASAGLYTHVDGPHARVPVGALKIGLIAEEREPHLTNDVLNDPRVGNKEWARREGMVAFAGYPLVVDGALVGVMALFAREPLMDDTLRALASVADSIAVGIDRKRVDDERARLFAREQAALAEAERQKARLESLFEQAPAGICVLRGPTHVFELANSRYVDLVGDRPLIGLPLADALPEVVAVVGPLLDRVYATGEPFVGNEVPVAVKRALVLEDRFFNFVYQPVIDAERRVEGVAVVAFEVTEQVRARLRAEELTRALETSNQDLDQFAYVASHDLKAPLRGIANLSQWIEEAIEAHITAETQNHMRLLRGRVNRLEALIDGILSYSRAGRSRTKVEKVDLGALAAECRDLLAPTPPAAIVIGKGMPILDAERVPLQQVLLNLLSNALKHAGRPDARVELECRDAGAFYEITFRDNGPGIAPEFHERVWGIFQTLEARDKVEGTGIGLSVVKKIVETRGGKVTLESDRGAGATFRVLWPKRAGLS